MVIPGQICRTIGPLTFHSQEMLNFEPGYPSENWGGGAFIGEFTAFNIYSFTIYYIFITVQSIDPCYSPAKRLLVSAPLN